MNRRAFLLSSALLGLSGPAPAMAAEPPLILEDYAVARAAFQTKLVRQGPAPDKGDPLTPPPGARSIGYGSGNRPLSAWLSDDAPKPGEKRPAVLFLHGGNALWHGHWDLTRPYREAGYVAMMPALRAENGQPGYFSGFYDETDDVLAAADALKALPGIDPTRIFLAGHSIGGTLTLLGAMASPLFRAAAAFSPNPDARAFFKRYPEDIRFDAENAREFDMRSVVCFAQSFKCPVLMLHGSKETRSEERISVTARRARAKGLAVTHGIVIGDHSSAIPGESAQALRFFANT
ncbi:alpha/beta fold hydrolase [Mesorhizobium sp. RP14(2022)]|uniref:Alpha/beta fold hydrolase n=1 Tax=Mesorhizobium liriopis TaxID=2953882 RepID=A0ABT1CAP5_9HYPH|nr:alpha/beta fold hydrolase [Mesorhizobium liriopis]MCO6051880.1 alpha/beta fold hydrolase [Mesorhizobium liriopis]